MVGTERAPYGLPRAETSSVCEKEFTMSDYEAPQIVEIGSLHELTLQEKVFGEDDGFTFQGNSIGVAS